MAISTEHPAIIVNQATIIHGKDGGHCITLPCCGTTVYLPAKPECIAVCRSCHRDLVDSEDVASQDPPICVWCYTA